ncbi:hypothetical protein N234_26460 [Ralstonia pickettii DTP0602]|nr:hypothetical protein N234_26460 [Ralstonia pickettii DTP0602]
MLWWAASVLCFLTPLLLAWIVMLYREVRLRRAAEIALKDQAAIQSALLDGIPQPVYLRDASLRLITCNRSYEELVGATRETLRGQGLDAPGHVHPIVTDMAEVARDYRKVLEDGAPLHKDRCLRLGDRNHHVLNWLTPLRGADGTVKGLAGGCVDLTERHEMLTELAQAKAEAEAANRAKSTFLASVSHEIRTPMNAITGMLELTLARCRLSEDERLQLVTAHKSALGLLGLIDDILDLSKMEAGKFRIQPAPAALARLVQDTLLIFGPVAAQKGLSLGSDLGAGLAPLHQVDGLRFRQILANLVSNAVRFTDHGTANATPAGTPGPPGGYRLRRPRSAGQAGRRQVRRDRVRLRHAGDGRPRLYARRAGARGRGLLRAGDRLHRQCRGGRPPGGTGRRHECRDRQAGRSPGAG